MLRLFNDNKPYVLFVLPFLLFGFYAFHFLVETQKIPELIAMGMWGNFKLNPGYIPYWIMAGFLLQLVISISVNFVFNEANFYERNNYLPSLISLLLMVGLQNFFGFSALPLSFLGVLLAVQQLLHLDQNSGAEKHLFNAAFSFSLSVSLFPPLIFGIPFLYLAGLIFRPFLLRDLIIFSLGPVVIFVHLFAFRTYFEVPHFWRNVSSMQESFRGNLTTYLFFGLLTMMVCLIFYTLSLKWNSFSNRARKELQLIMGLLIGLTPFAWLNFTFAVGLMVLPIAMLFTLPFLFKRIQPWSNGVIYGMFVFIVVKFLLKT